MSRGTTSSFFCPVMRMVCHKEGKSHDVQQETAPLRHCWLRSRLANSQAPSFLEKLGYDGHLHETSLCQVRVCKRRGEQIQRCGFLGLTANPPSASNLVKRSLHTEAFGVNSEGDVVCTIGLEGSIRKRFVFHPRDRIVSMSAEATRDTGYANSNEALSETTAERSFGPGRS